MVCALHGEAIISSFIIAALPDGPRAHAAALALAALHDEGSIALFGIGMMAREASGAVVVRPVPGAPRSPALEALLAATVAHGGRPSAEAAAELEALASFCMEADLVHAVLSALPPGGVGIVGEVTEHRLAPVDARIASLGGIVLRRHRVDIRELRVQREIEALEAELGELELELAGADADAGAAGALRTRAVATRRRLAAALAQARSLEARLQEEAAARTAALVRQAALAEAEAEAKARAQAQIEQAILRMREDSGQRSEALRRAIRLASEALGPDAES